MKVWNKDFNVYFILLMNDTNILRPPRKLLLKMVGLMLELASLFTRVFAEHLGIWGSEVKGSVYFETLLSWLS